MGEVVWAILLSGIRYHRWQPLVMAASVAVLIVVVQGIQLVGDRLPGATGGGNLYFNNAVQLQKT